MDIHVNDLLSELKNKEFVYDNSFKTHIRILPYVVDEKIYSWIVVLKDNDNIGKLTIDDEIVQYTDMKSLLKKIAKAYRSKYSEVEAGVKEYQKLICTNT